MLKEKLQEWLLNMFIQFRRDLRIDKAKARLEEPSYLNNLIYKNNMDIGKKIESFLATGNLNSPSGLDLMQVHQQCHSSSKKYISLSPPLQATGFTIIAERINYFRFLAHFRSIHRGAFFSEMKTTTVRKLLPESWGFLCPVHTPDGGPCGLLNHLASPCIVQTHHPSPETLAPISPLLASFGMLPVSRIPPPANALPVLLDGRIIGHVPSVLTQAVAQQLRLAKTLQNTLPHPVFDRLEIAVFSESTAAGSPAPGIFLFSSAGRMQRPVMSVAAARQEWIGPFEQINMGISVTPEAFDPQLHSHVEICPTNMLSAIASFTPYSDMNQSPRNMCVSADCFNCGI
jgi:DNA-directed RNA polymerase I subunit RPA2